MLDEAELLSPPSDLCFRFVNLLSVYLHYGKCNFPMTPHVRLLVVRSVGWMKAGLVGL